MYCSYCKKNKLDSDFEIANVIKGIHYRRKKCRRCKQDAENLRRRKTRLWIDDYKKSQSCTHCGFSDYRALDFHHKNPDEKEHCISNMLTWSTENILKEISKCQVLCANCHRILEHKKRLAVGESGCPA